METNEPKKILVFQGNSAHDSYCTQLANAYEDGAHEAGFEVDRVNIGDLAFDPVLHRGYKEVQQLEPDLRMVQDKILWADHIVFIYPNWWCSMPAYMKGMFDRMWLPGFAFNFDKDTKKVIPHLKGKTARIIICIGTQSPFTTWWKYGDFTNELAHGILGFAGIKARVTPLGPSERVSDDMRAKWLSGAERLGKKGG